MSRTGRRKNLWRCPWERPIPERGGLVARSLHESRQERKRRVKTLYLPIAGRGDRLRLGATASDFSSKAFINVGGIPLIEHVLREIPGIAQAIKIVYRTRQQFSQ